MFARIQKRKFDHDSALLCSKDQMHFMKRLLEPLFVLAICIVGCDRGALPNRVPRTSASPVIANDTRLIAFIGDWSEGGNSAIFIVRNADSSSTVSHPFGAGFVLVYWKT